MVYQKSSRVAAVAFPGDGWRRGLFLVGVYAPTSSSGIQLRHSLRHDISLLLELTPATSLAVVMGDLNAEMGSNQDRSIAGWDAMGTFSSPKITPSGQEWRERCSTYGLRDAASRFQGRNRVTWVHPRFRSHHELDHILIKGVDLWHLTQCRILVEGSSVEAPWSPYTDHNPVELILRVGKLWVPSRAQAQGSDLPDIRQMSGPSAEATERRLRWVAKVESLLSSFSEEPNWEQICELCRQVAVEVCGIIHLHQGAPWLRIHGTQIKAMDRAILQAQQWDRQARSAGDPLQAQRARSNLRQARKQKARQIKLWEVEWLSQKAEEANRTINTSATSNVFRLVQDLVFAVGKGHKDGGRAHAGSPAEVEAWKDHFQAIQQGIGEVDDSIWADITSRDADISLNDTPTWEEFLKAIGDMRLGKAGGDDLMLGEYLKFGGPKLRKEVYRIIQDTWATAASAPEGEEAARWPSSWKMGITIPLWKKKQPRSNKNNWRGITLLSVGSKLIARICAARLQRWYLPWGNPLQFGFKSGSGIDDVHQVTRRLLEEAAQSVHPHTILFKFFDLERAYPKVPRHALWKILTLKGCPDSFLKILKAIHNGTASKIRYQGFVSSSFVPERGLREGCPSSPILFNIFHDALMDVFRTRRERAAEVLQTHTGLDLTYKVDGRIAKRKGDRDEEGRNIKRICIGDFAYADDTGIVGHAEETMQAEQLFVSTVSHFGGRVHANKTESMRVGSEPPPAYDVPAAGERPSVKHVGAVLSDRAGHALDTDRAVRQGMGRVIHISSAWTKGRQIHLRRRDLRLSVRIRVLKAIVKGILFTFVRTRSWQTHQIHRLQSVINLAVRRAFNIRTYTLRRHGLSNAVLNRMVQWEPFLQSARRASLLWLGHVARMPTEAPQKQVLFGWITDARGKPHSPCKQAQWLNSCLRDAGISEIDWFRLAQNRNQWKSLVLKAYPHEEVLASRERELDNWRIGQPIPQWARVDPDLAQERQYDDSDNEIGDRRRGADDQEAQQPYGHTPRSSGHRPRDGGTLTCPVCQAVFTKHNQLAFHYESEHSVCDPKITTVQSFGCTQCMQTFRRATQLKSHVCPAKRVLPRFQQIDLEAQVHGPDRTFSQPLPTSFHIYTDGSGGSSSSAEAPPQAGWGVAVFSQSNPNMETPWLAALYGPVNVTVYDPIWMGARVLTNNTGEVSAIGEACRYLLDVHTKLPVDHPRCATIYYDSSYAYGAVTRLNKNKDNMELIDTVASLVASVRRVFNLKFVHVRAHTDIYGNEAADRLDSRGAQGRISPHSVIWATRPEGHLGHDPPPAAPNRAPRARAQMRRPAANVERRQGRWPLLTCPTCQTDFRSCDLPQHQPDCRGPDPANRTCKYCAKVYESIGARKNHERYSHAEAALRDGLIGHLPNRRTGRQ